MIERDKNTYNLTLPCLTILVLITIKIIMNETLNIVAWNANGINGRWCHLDDIRKKHHITFVEEHKLFKCELYKLSYNNLYTVYPVARKTLPDKLFGRCFEHGVIAAYWPIAMSNIITPIKKLSNDCMIVLKYKCNECCIYRRCLFTTARMLNSKFQ